ncbi:MAG: hypothetical protein K5668_04450, partial [Lachnospiraceae bacterium]|nr:hypothetical protein [Lachnospiraceae bacterium]
MRLVFLRGIGVDISLENALNIRRKGFYKRNGFCETGYYTFYDDTEFEIGCAGMEFDVELFS